MRLPFTKKAETRESAGGVTEILLNQQESAIAASAADLASTAAVEASAGLLSRSFMGAEVTGPDWVRELVTGDWLGLVGRDLVRQGQHLSAIRFGAERALLAPCGDWYWQAGTYDPATWRVRCSAYGPTAHHHWLLTLDSVVCIAWGRRSNYPYAGTGPLGFARTAAKAGFHSESTLANEMAGPVAQLLAIPMDGGAKGDDDPLKELKKDLAKAKGGAVLVETVAGAWGDGKENAPRRDWKAERMGPQPPEAVVRVAEAAFNRTLAATGCSPALFDDSDGTSKREALRQYHMGTVKPLAKMLETELSMKLGETVRLGFDNYPLDLAGRAQAFQKLVAGGVSVNDALATSGLLADD